MGLVDLPGVRRKRRNTKWKNIPHTGIQTHIPDIYSPILYRLIYADIVESCII